MPEWIQPELATLSDRPPTGADWLHETKFDGYRILAFVNDGQVKLRTRNNLDWTAKFGQLAAAFSKLNAHQAIIDGEACVIDDEGKSSFRLLQQSLQMAGSALFQYFAFDLMYLDGWDLRPVPLLTRKRLLQELLQHEASTVLRYSDHVTANGNEVFSNACALGWEGIVSKLASSPYISTRSKAWLKSKCSNEEEFIIVGYTPQSTGLPQIGALLLGRWSTDGALRYCGKVGTGFSSDERVELFRKLGRMRSDADTERAARIRNAVWVKPVLVAQVGFTEWTDEGRLRHPTFLGLRLDKAAAEVRDVVPWNAS